MRTTVIKSSSIVDGKPMYEQCPDCNYEKHICPGCGEFLTHSGHDSKGVVSGIAHNAIDKCYE